MNSSTDNMRLVIATISVLLAIQTAAAVESTQPWTAVQSTNAFTKELYNVLRNEEGNLVVSPLSVEAVLAIVWLGAGGETAQQLKTGLHLPENRTLAERGFKDLLSKLQSTDTVTLDVANNLYIQKDFHVKETFRQSAVDNFRSDIQEVNFANDTEVARTTINQWVEERTHNKIKDLIAPGTLNSDVLMILVNAIYFKGGWLKPFEEQETMEEPFYITPNKTVNVQMMHKRSRFLYTELPNLNAKALRLQYRGETMSMLFLLPNEKDGIGSLETSLSTFDLNTLSNVWHREVIVSLPKFKIEKNISLNDKLNQLGITEIFQTTSNLSRITDEQIVVSKVIQKTFVEVTEKGTEAAASTYLEIVPLSGFLGPIPEFHADHPFLFILTEDTTGAVLFMGRVAQPN